MVVISYKDVKKSQIPCKRTYLPTTNPLTGIPININPDYALGS